MLQSKEMLDRLFDKHHVLQQRIQAGNQRYRKRQGLRQVRSANLRRNGIFAFLFFGIRSQNLRLGRIQLDMENQRF